MKTSISYISRLKDSVLDFLKEDDVKIINNIWVKGKRG